MAAMMFGFVWLGTVFLTGAAAERWIPDNVWDKLFRALHIDE